MEERPINFLKYRVRRDAATPMYTTHLRDDLDFFRRATAGFGLNLLKGLEVDGSQNTLISPCLAAFPLLPLLAIADGETNIEIKRALCMDEVDDTYVHTKFKYGYYRLNQNGRRHDQWRPHGIKVWDLHPVYALVVKRSLLPPAVNWQRERAHNFLAYENVLHGVRRFDNVDYEAIMTMNTCVAGETGGKFKNALSMDAFPTGTNLAMVSAVTYDGIFVNSFKADKVERGEFHVNPMLSIWTQFLRNEALREYAENEECQVFGIEYCWGSLTMYILLPKEEVSFEQFEADLDAEKITAWLKLAAKHRTHKRYMVEYTIPAFSIKRSYDLSEAFRDKLGLQSLFDPDQFNLGTFLGQCTVDKPSAVGSVFHGVSLTVSKNVKGELNRFARPLREDLRQVSGSENVKFKADRPFFYCIYDHRAQLFFAMGRFVAPEQSDDRNDASDAIPGFQLTF